MDRTLQQISDDFANLAYEQADCFRERINLYGKLAMLATALGESLTADPEHIDKDGYKDNRKDNEFLVNRLTIVEMREHELHLRGKRLWIERELAGKCQPNEI